MYLYYGRSYLITLTVNIRAIPYIPLPKPSASRAVGKVGSIMYSSRWAFRYMNVDIS